MFLIIKLLIMHILILIVGVSIIISNTMSDTPKKSLTTDTVAYVAMIIWLIGLFMILK